MFSSLKGQMASIRWHRALALSLVAVCFNVTVNAQTPPMEAVTLEQAVERAIKNNPTIAQASQGILRAEGLLQQTRAATMPFVTASLTSLVNSTERRFDDVVTSPRIQGTFGAQVGMPVLAASRWAATMQARDQVEIATLSTADVRPTWQWRRRKRTGDYRAETRGRSDRARAGRPCPPRLRAPASRSGRRRDSTSCAPARSRDHRSTARDGAVRRRRAQERSAC